MCDTLRRRRFGSIVAGASILCCGALLGGCHSSAASEFRADPTPNVRGAAYTQDQVDNMMALTIDTNLRQFNEDLGRFFLFDRPTRFRRHTLPH